MTPGKITRTTTVDVTVELLDAEPRPRPYSRSGTAYRPTHLKCQFRSLSDGGWSVGTPTLVGRVLRKSGGDSNTGCDERLYGGDVPGWAAALVAEITPETPDAS